MSTARVRSTRIMEGRGQLSEAQKERMLNLSAAGWTNVEIAREYGCCDDTVARLRVKARALAAAN